MKKYVQFAYSISDGHISQFVEEELQLPPGRKFSRNAEDGYWIPPLNLVSKATDYDELKEARKNAQSAFRFLIVAIIIATVTLLVTIAKEAWI